MTEPVTLDELGSLPVVLTAGDLARVLRCDPDHLYELNQRGELPVEPLRLGRKLLWPTVPVLSALGIIWAAPAAADDAAEAALRLLESGGVP